MSIRNVNTANMSANGPTIEKSRRFKICLWLLEALERFLSTSKRTPIAVHETSVANTITKVGFTWL